MQNKDRSPQVGQSGLGFVYTVRFLLKMQKRRVKLLIFEWSACPFFVIYNIDLQRRNRTV